MQVEASNSGRSLVIGVLGSTGVGAGRGGLSAEVGFGRENLKDGNKI